MKITRVYEDRRHNMKDERRKRGKGGAEEARQQLPNEGGPFPRASGQSSCGPEVAEVVTRHTPPSRVSRENTGEHVEALKGVERIRSGFSNTRTDRRTLSERGECSLKYV